MQKKNQMQTLSMATSVAKKLNQLIFIRNFFLLAFRTQILNSATWTIETINSYMKLNTKLELTLHELSGLMNRITAQELTMRDFTEHQDTLERSTLEDFATMTVSASSIAIQGLLDRIHLLVTGAPDFQTFGNNGILKLIAADLDVSRKSIVCMTAYLLMHR
jgi:hypothetical protein